MRHLIRAGDAAFVVLIMVRRGRCVFLVELEEMGRQEKESTVAMCPGDSPSTLNQNRTLGS